jgi:hypothetical protein
MGAIDPKADGAMNEASNPIAKGKRLPPNDLARLFLIVSDFQINVFENRVLKVS